MFGLGVFGANE